MEEMPSAVSLKLKKRNIESRVKLHPDSGSSSSRNMQIHLESAGEQISSLVCRDAQRALQICLEISCHKI